MENEQLDYSFLAFIIHIHSLAAVLLLYILQYQMYPLKGFNPVCFGDAFDLPIV